MSPENSKPNLKFLKDFADSWEFILALLCCFVTFFLSVFGGFLPKIAEHLPDIINALTVTILGSLSFGLFNDRKDRIIRRETTQKSTFKGLTVEPTEPYEEVVRDLLKNTKRSIWLILRTGSILHELKEEFNELLERKGEVYIVTCKSDDDNITSMIELDSDHTSRKIKDMFADGNEAYEELQKKHGNQIQRKILNVPPTHLIYISDPSDPNGRAFVIPILFKVRTRKAPSTYFCSKDYQSLFKTYFSQTQEMWEEADDDKSSKRKI